MFSTPAGHSERGRCSETHGFAPAYDEGRDALGRPRPAYAALQRRLGHDLLDPPAEVRRQLSARPLGDDVRILPVPLVLEEARLAAIRAAVAQRASALQAFFHDIACGEGRFVDRIGANVLRSVLASEGESLEGLRRAWEGRDRDEVRFVYGPDLAREPGGDWLVLEDNVGCVGGAADSFFVMEAFARAAGLPAPAPESADVVGAVERWRGLLGDGPTVATAGCEPRGAQVGVREEVRRRRLLGVGGVDVLDSGALERLLRSRERAPRALLNFAPLPAGGCAQLVDRRRVALLNATGTGVLGNKALLGYVEEMIRFFLDEQPLMRTAPTHILLGDALPQPAGSWVVKTATGSGGGGVFVLAARRTEELDAVLRVVAAAGLCGTVAQRWIDCSTLPREPSRIELRPLTYVLGWRSALVGRTFVGKAVHARDPGALNNISRGARYVAVMSETAFLEKPHPR